METMKNDFNTSEVASVPADSTLLTDNTTPVVDAPKSVKTGKFVLPTIALIIVVALTSYLYLQQKNAKVQDVTPTPTPTVTNVVEETPTPTNFPDEVTIQTSSTNKNITWKSYESKLLGVIFTYPSNYTVSQVAVSNANDFNEPAYFLSSQNDMIQIKIMKGFNDPIDDGNYSPRTDMYGKPLKYTINGEQNTSLVSGLGEGMPCDDTNKVFSSRGNTYHTWVVGKAITVSYSIDENKECGKKLVEPSSSDFATAKKIIESIKLTKDAVVFVPTPTE